MTTLSRSTSLRRTPFKRKPLGERPPILTSTTPRRRKCMVCTEPFKPQRFGQKVCGPACAQVQGRRETEKQERKEAKERKAKLKTRSDWMKEAQVWFNKAVRARDRRAGYPCISSGRPLNWAGNDVDAGHYRSVGSAPNLRFNFDNCHAQSKHDNQWKSGNAVDYRINLIARIGIDRVEAIEADNTPRKWAIDELKTMIMEFKKMVKDLSLSN